MTVNEYKNGTAFKIGDHVEKVGGDYTFVGVVVAAFEKLSGAERFVVEDDRGVLHVYSAKILRLQKPTFFEKAIFKLLSYWE